MPDHNSTNEEEPVPLDLLPVSLFVMRLSTLLSSDGGYIVLKSLFLMLNE